MQSVAQFLVTASLVIAIAYLATVATVAIVAALRAGGRREEPAESHEALSVSRFTIPVSIIVPVSKNSASVSPAISSLLALNYPEFEVIVVVDAGTPDTLEALTHDWHLEAREFFYRRTLETSGVCRIYRSGTDGRLMVIDKTPVVGTVRSVPVVRTFRSASEGYSDALNCGVNVSRYRYFMSVSPEVVFDSDALLRVMASALRDPANVVGASNHVEQGADATESAYASLVDERAIVKGEHEGVVGRVGALFQRLASARSLMDSRLAWRHFGAGLGPKDAVVVWRRDAVIKLGGFSQTAADPDLDMMFRLQTTGGEGAGRFDRGVDVFGRVGPQPLRGALRLAGRRQLAALQILWACLGGKARSLDPRTLAYFVESELVTPLAQAWIVTATLAGAALGWFTWSAVVLALVLLSFGNAAVSGAALLLRGASPGAPEEPELRRLLVAGPLEFVLYRPVLAVARIAAAMAFVTSGLVRRS